MDKTFSVPWLAVIVLFALLSGSIDAQQVRPLTDLKMDGSAGAAIDDAGTVVFVASNTDPLGTNPLHARQILRFTVPGGGSSQVAVFDGGVGKAVSVTDDGLWVVTVSRSDPLGQNHDLSYELFLMSSDGTSVVQLTNDPSVTARPVQQAVISGSGNRVLFRAETDPLGTNPGGDAQLFIVDADGSNLIQLTNATNAGSFGGCDISDDGNRIVFAHRGDLTGGNPDGTAEVFEILADGTQLTQKTSSATSDSIFPKISGNGLRVFFFVDFADIFVSNWGSSVSHMLVAGFDPSITDDGGWVYYVAEDANNQEIFSISASGGPATQLTFTDPPFYAHSPVVSGANQRVVFQVGDDAFWPSGWSEVMVMDANGSNTAQLTDNLVFDGYDDKPDVTPDGTRVVFQSRGDFTGTGNLATSEIFRVQADGSDLVRLTTNAWATHPTISTDGSLIVFHSYENLTGQNPGGLPGIFQINADGSGLVQVALAGSGVVSLSPEVSGDGSFVVFQDSSALSRVPSGGGGAVTTIFDDGSVGKALRLSEDGQWMAYRTTTNFDGLNPGGFRNVFRTRTDGSLIERLTSGEADSPDIDATGNRVVYTSPSDPLGTNADLNWEIFLYEASTDTTQQLTVTTGSTSFRPRISGDGQFVYFISDEPFFETLSYERHDFYRVNVGSGAIERAAGLRDPRSSFGAYVATNSGAVVTGRALLTNLNHDLSRQTWIVDFDTPATIRPAKGSPTVVDWDVEPGPVRYDVVRGDVANLQPGAPGETDLGPVVCIEDDSPDATTAGFEDALQPSPGQVLFYAHRGTSGMLAGPGSYGTASDGSERVPSSGNCLP